MKQDRRKVLKALGLGSGAAFVQPISLIGKSYDESEISRIDQTPYVTKKLKTDICIAGGGLSGLCAAIAAARNGSKVILVQDRSRLGGNASSEIRMHVLGANNNKSAGWRETGLIEELKLTEAVVNQQRSFEIWDYVMYDKAVSEENLSLLMDSIIYETDTSSDFIKKVRAICSNTETIYEIEASYFMDCTGDGTLAALSGAEFMRGREGRNHWGEDLAPDETDEYTMGNSILLFAEKYDRPMPYTPPAWAKEFTFKDFIYRRIGSYEYGYWWVEIGGLGDIIKDGQELRHELLRIVFGIWDYIKNSGNHKDSTNWALNWVGMIPGKRESRRIVGDYIMKQDDVLNPKLYYDRVAYGGWPLDDHPPEGMTNTGIEPFRTIKLDAPYSIPLRSLYSKNIKNLFMAGRNISVSHVALSSTRVMATCSTIGQAAGTAAAVCKKLKMMPGQLTQDREKVAELLQLLLRQDQSMLGVKNEDPLDLAKSAKIKASSEVVKGSAKAVIDGVNRDQGDGVCHQWRASMDTENPWLELSWNKKQNIKSIEITFDTALHKDLFLTGSDGHYNKQVRGAQLETVADYEIEAEGHGVVIEIKDNFLRRVAHKVDISETKSIRITVKRTNGDAVARIFEIRCYA